VRHPGQHPQQPSRIFGSIAHQLSKVADGRDDKRRWRRGHGSSRSDQAGAV